MFRGDSGKWSRWALGFLWGLVGGGGQQLEDVLESCWARARVEAGSNVCGSMCHRLCLGRGS